MSRKLWRVALFLVASFTQGRASVIFSNVVGNTIPNSGVGVALGSCCSVAFNFTTPANSTYSLTGIDMALESNFGSSALVSLMTDTAGQPGVVLESFSMSNLQPFDDQPHLLSSANSILAPQLFGGTQYWVAVTTSSDGAADWIWNTTADTGPEAFQTSNFSWTTISSNMTEGAFRVDGDPLVSAVPEPSLVFLLPFCLVIFAAFSIEDEEPRARVRDQD